MPYNGGKVDLNDFTKDDMISFQKTNLKSIIHYKKDIITSFDFNVHNLSTRFKVPHKDPLNIIQGHMSFIHLIIKGFSILSQDIIYSYSYTYQVRDKSLPT